MSSVNVGGGFWINIYMDINRLKHLAGLNEEVTPDDIQKVFFGDLKGSPEKDTEKESKLFNSVEDYIDQATPGNRVKAEKIISDLMSLKQYYPADLVPNAKVVYRGLNLSDDKKNLYVDVLKDNIKNLRYNRWYKLTDFQYTPMTNIESWSTKRNVAAAFAANRNEDPDSFDYREGYPVIMMTTVDDSFVMSSKLTNMMSYRNFQSKEFEILRVSNSSKPCTLLVYGDWLLGWYQENFT